MRGRQGIRRAASRCCRSDCTGAWRYTTPRRRKGRHGHIEVPMDLEMTKGVFGNVIDEDEKQRQATKEIEAQIAFSRRYAKPGRRRSSKDDSALDYRAPLAALGAGLAKRETGGGAVGVHVGQLLAHEVDAFLIGRRHRDRPSTAAWPEQQVG